MKDSSLKRSMLKIGAMLLLMLSIGLTQVPGASWSRLGEVTGNWLTNSWHILSDVKVIDVVSAWDIQNQLGAWKTWPKSAKHKGLDGGWILPFEIFDQKYSRGQMVPYRQPAYTDMPVSIDINGDGLLDLVYSKADFSINTNGGGYETVWGGVTQYIILRRANGFELAYKCKQVSEPVGTNGSQRWYYGDCADMSYTKGTDLAYEQAWTPMNYFYQQAKSWTNKHPILTNDDRANYNGTGDETFDYIFYDYWVNGTQRNTIDRQKPLIKDLNGDGLPDLIFFGYLDAGATYSGGPNTAQNLNIVMYNNGHGFDMGAGCIQVPGDWIYPNHLPNIPLATPMTNGFMCY